MSPPDAVASPPHLIPPSIHLDNFSQGVRLPERPDDRELVHLHRWRPGPPDGPGAAGRIRHGPHTRSEPPRSSRGCSSCPMFLPSNISIIPLFVVTLKLHLVDTYAGLILPDRGLDGVRHPAVPAVLLDLAARPHRRGADRRCRLVADAALDRHPARPAGDRGVLGDHLPHRVEHVHLAADRRRRATTSRSSRWRSRRWRGARTTSSRRASVRLRPCSAPAGGRGVPARAAVVHQRRRWDGARMTATRTGPRLEYRHENHWLLVEPWGPDSVRVRAGRGPMVDVVGALGPPGTVLRREVEDADDGQCLVNGCSAVELRDGLLTFVEVGHGVELLAEMPAHFAWPGARLFAPTGNGYYRSSSASGLRRRAHVRARPAPARPPGPEGDGARPGPAQRRRVDPVPGLLARLRPAVEPPGGRPRRARGQRHAVGGGLGAPDRLLGHHRRRAGRHPAALRRRHRSRTRSFPAWAAGFWQSKLRYRNQEELLDVAREYHRLGPAAVASSSPTTTTGPTWGTGGSTRWTGRTRAPWSTSSRRWAYA